MAKPSRKTRPSLRRVKPTDHRYVVSDTRVLGGEAVIAGTRTPVRAIVELYRAGVAAEEVPAHLPHLTMAQVFDALSYFSDHKGEITEHIRRNRVSVKPDRAGR